MSALADEMPLGVDPGDRPLKKSIRIAPSRVSIEVVCSAVRRLEAHHIAEVLRDIATNWAEMLRELEPLEAGV